MDNSPVIVNDTELLRQFHAVNAKCASRDAFTVQCEASVQGYHKLATWIRDNTDLYEHAVKHGMQAGEVTVKK